MNEPTGRGRILGEAAAASALVTGLAAACMRLLPASWHGTAVGAVFLVATYVLVWRRDDDEVARAGLSLGGLVAATSDRRSAPMQALTTCGWALGAALVTFVPFYFGWRFVWHPPRHFVFPGMMFVGRIALGQLVGVALPEEAFYRGYLQTRLDDVWSPRLRIAGAPIGWSLLATSVVFALGHVATLPFASRLAVFFPSLLFGWLRSRTGGIGASTLFHAACNTLSEVLGAGYGTY